MNARTARRARKVATALIWWRKTPTWAPPPGIPYRLFKDNEWRRKHFVYPHNRRAAR